MNRRTARNLPLDLTSLSQPSRVRPTQPSCPVPLSAFRLPAALSGTIRILKAHTQRFRRPAHFETPQSPVTGNESNNKTTGRGDTITDGARSMIDKCRKPHANSTRLTCGEKTATPCRYSRHEQSAGYDHDHRQESKLSCGSGVASKFTRVSHLYQCLKYEPQELSNLPKVSRTSRV